MRSVASWRSLYVQVLIAIAVGILLGTCWPHFAQQLKPLGDGFIKLIRLLIAPIIFCTVVTGIAGVAKLRDVGKAGGLALLYFEVVSTIALLIGLVVVNVVKPGVGRKRRRREPRCTRGGAVRRSRGHAGGHRLHPQHHPHDVLRRLRERGRAADPAPGDSLWLCTARGGRQGESASTSWWRRRARSFSSSSVRHAPRAARGAGRDGVHRRALRRGVAAFTGAPHGMLLPHLRAVRARGPGTDRAPARLFDLRLHPLHP